ncbi:LPXTG cell wall anchor domain-containing protein [Bacillaceae bacterium Marseille-Q3522]|nr:LPXTG cell wall anchor domain-containing protein [Bacillaceae bacterium Marseille-Q3522]
MDKTPPEKPTANEVTDTDTFITGTAESGATVIVKAENSKLGSTKADDKGIYKVAIPIQPAGTVITIYAEDLNGNISEDMLVTVIKKPGEQTNDGNQNTAPDNQGPDSASNLPNTSTNSYNWLLIGAILIFAGGTGWVLGQRRKRMNEH